MGYTRKRGGAARWFAACLQRKSPFPYPGVLRRDFEPNVPNELF